MKVSLWNSRVQDLILDSSIFSLSSVYDQYSVQLIGVKSPNPFITSKLSKNDFFLDKIDWHSKVNFKMNEYTILIGVIESILKISLEMST